MNKKINLNVFGFIYLAPLILVLVSCSSTADQSKVIQATGATVSVSRALIVPQDPLTPYLGIFSTKILYLFGMYSYESK